ncbi:DNA-directed DNA polymerase [Ochrobactrum phage vB_OspM_OC]|nr:DNA-directed DNA polymerase [Ochrobactrum phage vB_OspM_OC]
MYFYTNAVKWGNNILLRGYENGEPFNRKVPYEPTLFTLSNDPTGYKTLEGKNVKPHHFDGLKDANNFINQYKDVDGFEIYGMDNFTYAFLSDEFPDEAVAYNRSLIRIGRLDIETEVTEGSRPDPYGTPEVINVITVEWNRTYYVFAINDYVPDPNRKTVFKKYDYEHEMLADFVRFMEETGFDIITGWYSAGFDLPYIINRIRKVLDDSFAKRLSPWKEIREREYYENGKLVKEYTLLGVTHIDYQFLYKKMGFSPQASYALEWVCRNELGKGKLKLDNGIPGHLLYRTDPQNHIEYNVQDVELLADLDDKKKLFDLIISMTYDAKCNYEDILHNTRMWDAILFNYLKKNNIVIPPRQSNPKVKFEGAYVKEVEPHFSPWVVSFDLTSLYPSIIMHYNISPETMRGFVSGVSLNHLINQDDFAERKRFQNENLCMSANGVLYTRDFKGIIPEVIELFFNKRKEHKNKMLDAARLAQDFKNKGDTAEYDKWSLTEAIENVSQNARKVAINALYGALGEPNFRYYSLKNAEAVTISGQLTILSAMKYINEYLNKTLGTFDQEYVVYGDTDSIYLDCSKFVDILLAKRPNATKEDIVNFLDRVSDEKLQPVFDKCFEDLADYLNSFQRKLSFKREKICEVMIQTAKKRYGLYVWDSEKVRYSEPKLTVTGLEVVQTSTPHKVREWMGDAMKIIITGQEKDIWEFTNKKREEFKNMAFHEIGISKGISDLGKYTDHKGNPIKGAPQNAKASALYNKLLNHHNLKERYDLINSGDKIKIVALKTPNPLGFKDLACLTELPKEFQLDGFIDYDTQFQKVFEEPLSRLLETRRWTLEEQATLDDFFF